MARKDTLTPKGAKRAEADDWFAKCGWDRPDGPTIREEPSKPTGHQLLTEAAEALRKGEWDPADGPYQPKLWWWECCGSSGSPFPNHTEPPATIRFGVKEAAAAAAGKPAQKPKKTDRGDER